MEEKMKLKELVILVKKKNPDIDTDTWVDKVMESFCKWRPFYNDELNHWRVQAYELVNNFS